MSYCLIIDLDLADISPLPTGLMLSSTNRWCWREIARCEKDEGDFSSCFLLLLCYSRQTGDEWVLETLTTVAVSFHGSGK